MNTLLNIVLSGVALLVIYPGPLLFWIVLKIVRPGTTLQKYLRNMLIVQAASYIPFLVALIARDRNRGQLSILNVELAIGNKPDE